MSDADIARVGPAFRIDSFEPGAAEASFFQVGDVLVFTGHAEEALRDGKDNAESLLRTAARGPVSVVLVRDGQAVAVRFERATTGLALVACAVPEAAQSPLDDQPWIEIFRDERGFHALLAEHRSTLALVSPLMYFYAEGAWRQLVTVSCFCLVALAIHPLFFIATHVLWGAMAWHSGPQLVAADFRYYERRLWARLACGPQQRPRFFPRESRAFAPQPGGGD